MAESEWMLDAPWCQFLDRVHLPNTRFDVDQQNIGVPVDTGLAANPGDDTQTALALRTHQPWRGTTAPGTGFEKRTRPCAARWRCETPVSVALP
jgi:hypothetical protein